MLETLLPRQPLDGEGPSIPVHEQELATILCPVDRGVKPLVEALTRLGAQTIASCEGPPAQVYFVAGESWRENSWKDLCYLVFGVLGQHLHPRFGDTIELKVQYGGAPQSQALLVVHPPQMDEVLDVLRRVHGSGMP